MSPASKIMLVDIPGWQGSAAGNNPYPNVGIAYLVPILEREGFYVSVVDMNNVATSDEDLSAAVASFVPQIIGFSVKTATAQNARRLGSFLKGRYPGIPIVVGGPHATVMGRELLEEPWIDVVVMGEAEETFPRLCRTLIAGEKTGFPGVVRRNDVRDVEVLPSLIDSLDALLLPDYRHFSPGVRATLLSSYPLVTSRGCVYQCIYCSVPKISGYRLRKRSLVRIIEELRHAKEAYGIEGFQVVDDAFNVDMGRAKEFCRMLIDTGLGFRWSCPNGLRADRIDDELAGLMFRAGCSSVMVGIESADPDVLAAVRKGESIQDIERGIRIFQNAGISVGGYFIIGLPGDSLEAEVRSVQFAKRMGIIAHFNMLIPYPRTDLWKWMHKNARTLLDIEQGMHFADDPSVVHPVFETDTFSAADRMRAYEMTHTLLGQFHMIIPRSATSWRRVQRTAYLIWKYDRRNALVRIPRELVSMMLGSMRGSLASCRRSG